MALLYGEVRETEHGVVYGAPKRSQTWEEHPNKYLGSYSYDSSRGGYIMKPTLAEAQAMCEARGSLCGGITYEPASNRYTGRSSSTLRSSPNGETSWVLSTAPQHVTYLPQPSMDAVAFCRRHANHGTTNQDGKWVLRRAQAAIRVGDMATVQGQKKS